MYEIKCPHCQKVFQVDEAGYAAIQQQVRDDEFHRAVAMQQERFENELRAAKSAAESEKKAAVAEAKAEIQQADSIRIAELESKLTRAEAEQRLAVSEAQRASESSLYDKEAEITWLNGKIALMQAEHEKEMESFKREQAIVIRQKDEEIAFHKDLKIRQSTKMVGETLEQHCETTFNQVRAIGFSRAYFEKDNDAAEGTKGDYIFRDYDEDGIEYISIMFEMKNQMDETATKHKNEDFFRKLDTDRTKKGCEYAVLVSTLESENEYYNNGIVDVSHRYPKMYVIRPQFFLPLITILRNAALNSIGYKRELMQIREQNVDVQAFADALTDFRDKFGKNYELASRRFREAIESIDKSIAQLEKTKQALLSSENNLRLANNKAEDLTIKRLVKNNPTMRQRFEDADIPIT